jgi:type II secretory pathway pseudopilin PulG
MKTTRANPKSGAAAAPGRPAHRHSSCLSYPSLSSLSSPSQSAFTMIEIAIAIGVIGFALVAIIGILPVGLNVQKESHQDSSISQDGPFFLEAIRNGGPTNGPGTSTSLDFLTNYVESITITNIYAINNNNVITNVIISNNPSSGQIILGMLSTPKYPAEVTNYLSLSLATNLPGPVTNYVTARMRGLTGAATEQNGSNAVVAFRYLMNVEIQPFASASINSLDSTNEIPLLANNLYELRLKFSWPVLNLVNGKVGPGRQTYRTLVSGQLQYYTTNGATFWFFQPNLY